MKKKKKKGKMDGEKTNLVFKGKKKEDVYVYIALS
jgi:hypothetical protein